MDKLEELMTPIQESSTDLVRCEHEEADNVEVDFCEEGGLVIKYQKDIMIITRDVLQNIILIVENNDRERKAADILRRENEDRERMIDFIETSELQEVKNWYGTDDVCGMLQDWDEISSLHHYGVHSYISTLLGNALIDLNNYAIRDAVIKRISK